MVVPDWIDRVAGDLLDAEHELRTALRDMRGEPGERTNIATRSVGGGLSRVTITENQARTLLRAVMPTPMATSRSRRRPHARMLVALTLYSAHLLALNDATNDAVAHRRAEDPAIVTALAMRDALDGWIAAARWQQATRRARVRWARAESAVSAIMRQQTDAGAGTAGQRDPWQLDLEALEGGAFADAQDPGRAQARRATRRRAAHAALALPEADAANVVPLVAPPRRRRRG